MSASVELRRLTLPVGENIRHSLDLSSAVNLKSIAFRYETPILDVSWITAAVKSIKSPHVKEIALHMPGDLTTRENIDTQLPDTVPTQWRALDEAPVKCLTARSFKLKVIVLPGTDETAFKARLERLLPKLVRKKVLVVAQVFGNTCVGVLS